MEAFRGATAAAGNDGINNDTSTRRAFPASFGLSNIISVAATDSKDARPKWSNYGKTSVDLGAPGVGIQSTIPGSGYASYSGTSMATPHVAGTVALIVAARPDLASSPATVKSLILSHVDPVSSLSTRTVSGGRLNAFKALSAAATATAAASSTSDSGDDSTGSNSGPNGPNRAQILQAFFSAALDWAVTFPFQEAERDTSSLQTTPLARETGSRGTSATDDALAADATATTIPGIIACTGSMYVDYELEEAELELMEVANC